MAALSRAAIRGYVEHRRTVIRTIGRKQVKGVSDDTIRNELATLRAALNHARKEGRLADVPHIDMPPRQPAKERWLTRQEADKLIKAAKTPHMRLFILLALNTGQRSKSILELQWFQVDMKNRLIHFNPPGRKQTSKKRVSVPMNETLLKALRIARRKAKGSWVVSWQGKSLDRMKNAFKRLCEGLGFEGVTPHTLRHTAGTWMAQAGVDMFQISGILGHSNSRTTELYLKHHPDYLREAVAALAGGKQVANKSGKKRTKTEKRGA